MKSMQNTILKTTELSRYYGRFKALDGVSIELEAGNIYGLIGQNGAGKSTLMRLIGGLSYPTAGEIQLFGRTGRALAEERKRVGCMIEYPGITPGLTAQENMHFRRLMKGIPNPETEHEILELVGLSDTGKKKAKDFSLGMKQRLGIAIALLGNPELLILDEPINGLDPIGVVEIRKLLKRLCEERGMTILISSHNLPELYQTANRYIIIHHGQIQKALTIEELDECCRHHIHITCREPEKLVRVMEEELHTDRYQVLPNQSVKLFDFLDEKEMVMRILMKHNIVVSDFSSREDTLEQYFISVIGGKQDD